jgi:hypothetical protein
VQKKPDPRPQFGFRILLGWGYCSVGYIILFIGSWAKEILKRLPSPYVSQFYLSFRVRPELLVAQTGFMQGAAGVGMWLLRFDAFERGKKPLITFPDSPF